MLEDGDARAVPSSSGRTAKTRSRVRTCCRERGRDGTTPGRASAFVDAMKCDSRCVGARWPSEKWKTTRLLPISRSHCRDGAMLR